MRLRLFIGIALALMIVAACQGPPPTQIILVVTATPPPGADGVTSVTGTPTANLQTNEQPTDRPTPRHTRTPESTAHATETLAPPLTLTPEGFPTPTTSQIQVAEQVFEHGRMFWVQPTKQIWVLVVTSEGRGTWTVYPDTFEDGEPEIDPSIVPPDGMMQPKRGFGKLWRTTPEVRNGLGWATTPEFGYVSNYEYHPGGTMNGSTYVPGPGYHILYSLYGEQFRFNEVDSTWQLGSD